MGDRVDAHGMTHSCERAPLEPPKVAEHLLAEIIEHDDGNGALANATADDLRDALRLAADELRIRRGMAPRSAWLIGIRRLVAEVWLLAKQNKIDQRSPAADAALDMRDTIDPRWEPRVEEERIQHG